MPIRIAVIADSHFHPAGPPGERPAQAAWEADAWFGARNAVAVELVNRSKPSIVVHLGDVVHPIPGLPEHERALAAARDTYSALEAPLLVAPGNHDVGDKPHPWAPAPSVSVAKHDTFSRWWGRPWWAVEHQGLLLVGIDTPVLNSGLPLEEEQWAWLEATLVPGRRTFVFLHYPPFLLRADEAEHYDNLAEPGRSRLLDLFARAGVEAVCCGHVHHPFWNPHRGTDFYLLPSTAFVRPEYSELGRIEPGPAFGRDDTERLGFLLLDVEEQGHRVTWIPTGGAVEPPPVEPRLGPGEVQADCPLGLTLRHAWDVVLDLPADGLEPFRRKRARNDLVLLATWELGVRLLRVPLDDLRDPTTRERAMALAARRGVRFLPFTAEPPTDADRAMLEACAEAIEAVELVVPRARLDAALPELPVPRWVAPLGRAPGETGAYFSHFSPCGFLPGDADLPRVRAEGVVFRIEPDADPEVVVPELRAPGGGVAAALVLLPRAGESASFDDDRGVEERVHAAFLAARANPQARVVLDTTVDQDRGYFPRHGLLDRRGNPRPAYRSLVRWSKGVG